MGLSIRSEKGKIYPVLTCDTCGQPIENWGSGIVAFPMPAEDSIAGVQVFHKGKCDPGSALRRDKEATNVLEEVDDYLKKRGAQLWQQLDHYLPWLLWNHKWGIRHRHKEGAKLTLDVPEPLDF